ncbi:MAG: beta-lactamase family protein [Actinomycetia bacterium]|nr:beta-lactamase family protein [Actinomycetes bacterium]
MLAAGAPGAQLVALQDGAVVVDAVAGDALRWRDDAGELAELAEADRERVTADTWFDLASLTKLFTAAVVLRLRERGELDLDEPIARRLPGAAAGAATLRQLLTHTAGLPATDGLERVPGTAADRWAALRAIAPIAAPGAAHCYSCVGYLLAGAIVKAVTGEDLATHVGELITGPLGMSAGYRPADPRACAATEFQPELGRGMVRGVVHDESAWSLGGVAGNAGLFANARAVARFAEMIRRGGLDGQGRRILAADSVAEMLTPHPAPGAAYRQGIGFRLGDFERTGSATSVGHPGFTGTLLVIEPAQGRTLVLLSNAIHPRRDAVDKTAVYRAALRSVWPPR